MKPKKRQKLCHNCEGDIDIDVIVCPYCAADLREEKPEQRYSSFVSESHFMSQKPSSESLYPQQMTQDNEEDIQDSPLSSVADEEDKKVGVIVPTILFTIGVQLCVFSLLMAIFSHNGTVLLRWDARFWFFYLFGSIPFLVFGFKSLSRL